MRNKLWIGLFLFFIIPGLLFTVSCSKKNVQTGDPAADAAAEQARQDELAKQRALEEENLTAEQRKEMMLREQFGEVDVFFAYDSSALSPQAREVLRQKYEWLRTNPDGMIVIEGHCDERGTTEYNLALGDRRAENAKRFLTDLGISGARLTTISYGEENPLDTGHGESAWARNRRAHFVIR